MRSPDSLQVVVIESPYETLADPQAASPFLANLRLKLKSYRNVYRHGTLPLDAYDFVSTHHLVGENRIDGFHPLMGYRTITLEQCEAHNLPFTGTAILRNSGALVHAQVLEGMLANWKRAGRKVSYASSWAIDPDLRGDPETRTLMKHLFTAFLTRHEQETGTHEALGAAVLKVHTDEYFATMGYQPVLHEGRPLPPFQQSSLLGEKVILVHCPKYTEHAEALAKKYESLWERRHVIRAAPGAAPLRIAA